MLTIVDIIFLYQHITELHVPQTVTETSVKYTDLREIYWEILASIVKLKPLSCSFIFNFKKVKFMIKILKTK